MLFFVRGCQRADVLIRCACKVRSQRLHRRLGEFDARIRYVLGQGRAGYGGFVSSTDQVFLPFICHKLLCKDWRPSVSHFLALLFGKWRLLSIHTRQVRATDLMAQMVLPFSGFLQCHLNHDFVATLIIQSTLLRRAKSLRQVLFHTDRRRALDIFLISTFMVPVFAAD